MRAKPGCGYLCIKCIQSLVLSALAFEACFALRAYAHSGGTDSNGCHAGTQPYHCHTPKSPSSGSDSRGSSLGPSVVRSYAADDPVVPKKWVRPEGCDGLHLSPLLAAADKGEVRIACGAILMHIKRH